MDITNQTDIQNVRKGDEVQNNQMGQGAPQRQTINVDLSKAEDVVCLQCGGPYFMEGIRIKKLSMLLSPTGREEMANMQVLLCMQCGLEMGQQPVKEVSE